MKNNKSFEDSFKKEIDSIMLLGDSQTGKSSILIRYSENQFTEMQMTTIGVSFINKTELIGDRKCSFRIWDTAGQDKFRSLTASYYQKADGIMLVYDITNRISFENINNWLNDIKMRTNKIPFMLIGNKCDLEEKREVKADEGDKLAKDLNISFFETSAKDGTNIREAFRRLEKEIIQKKGDRGEKGESILIHLGQKKEKKKQSCCT